MILLCCLMLLIDSYTIRGIRNALQKWRFAQSRIFRNSYWIISIILSAFALTGVFLKWGLGLRAGFLLVFFIGFFGKLFFVLFYLADNIRRRYILRYKRPSAIEAEIKPKQLDAIPRSEFLLKAGLLAGSIPFAALGLGILTGGAYDYQVKRRVLYLPNLPRAFDGIKLGQISDIHSGSFYNKKAVLGGVEMLLREKTDLIFFTGDLVNDFATEMRDYQDIFTKVKAPLGVYSSMGNHDYGAYYDWPNLKALRKNITDIEGIHKLMGWDLLLNANRRLKVDGEEIGILGVENWSAVNSYQKHGRLDLAVKNTDDLPVKLLLSHDPSHWRAQVLPHYPQIDVMFAGHTHGMQMGVRTDSFQWSPVEYVYKEWAGMYHEGQQQLYVNVGYGFLGYPGRVGILPEITIFELKSKTA